MRKRVFSGIQPTGSLHLGNYLGALKNWVSLLDSYDCIFCIVDYHAITAHYETKAFRGNILEAAMSCISVGIDPHKCHLFVQSDVTQHTELAWIFNTVTPMALLERMTQFKEKSEQHKKNVNAGLFTYPVLQAADILLYKAGAVPVGEDQAQHVELTREVARHFNQRFSCEVFPEPETLLSDVPRVIGLDGEHKMSKSRGNDIALKDTPDAVWKKLSSAVTDTARQRRSDPGRPEHCNVFSLHRFMSSPEEVAEMSQECRKAGIGCVDCKRILNKNINVILDPIRQKRAELDRNISFVWDILVSSAEWLRPIASQTMEAARSAMGLA